MGAGILIVDDNPINLRLASEVLRHAGHLVVNAANAEQALEMLRHFTPQLVLMDVALPGMDGLSLTRLLKADERLRAVPIIALTAYAMKGDEQRALDAGCDGYIAKPLDTRRLPEQVAAYLRRDSQ
jgi:CheY-like chemotaxis protein